jgi:hypothetical protein
MIMNPPRHTLPIHKPDWRAGAAVAVGVLGLVILFRGPAPSPRIRVASLAPAPRAAATTQLASDRANSARIRAELSGDHPDAAAENAT